MPHPPFFGGMVWTSHPPFFRDGSHPKKKGQKKGDPPFFIQMAHDPPFLKAIGRYPSKNWGIPLFFSFFLWIASSGSLPGPSPPTTFGMGKITGTNDFAKRLLTFSRNHMDQGGWINLKKCAPAGTRTKVEFPSISNWPRKAVLGQVWSQL